MMSYEKLEEALKQTGLPVKKNKYYGIKTEYIVWQVETLQLTNYVDNNADERVAWYQVHLFAGKNADDASYTNSIINLLVEAGFKVSETTHLFEGEDETETIHVVIPCHIAETKGD